ncbi:hypothetical protein MSAN_02502000 [Mycena sanguinolenta]|uniref:Uncharacterized protein n=1 Tax=Mycena sanguinolenta TaxID=230812 RepID=A0A8H6U1M0_9AGAR|nr:hypothetical protein MSAN_02502000 [Mycena sanguinolenta]
MVSTGRYLRYRRCRYLVKFKERGIEAFETRKPDPKLAMTPENIKPLLENMQEVHARLSDCIVEIRSSLAARL